jgi:hypothetical protein
MTAFRAWLLESATELAASDAHPSDPNMHLASAMSADRRVVGGHGGSTTSTSTTSTTSRNQPHGRHVALDYKTFLIEGTEETMARLRQEHLMVARAMVDRDVPVRQVARSLGVNESTLR